jgi:hypothetical protein
VAAPKAQEAGGSVTAPPTGFQVDRFHGRIDLTPVGQDLEPQRTVALDSLRFNAIAEAAAAAESFAREVAGAAERGERLRVRAYAGLLSRAARNALVAIAELGVAEAVE